jgi:hypothetical protein
VPMAGVVADVRTVTARMAAVVGVVAGAAANAAMVC